MSAPTFSPASTTFNGTVGVPFSSSYTCTSGTTGPGVSVIRGYAGGPPPGVTYNQATVTAQFTDTFNGTPTTAGTYTQTIYLTNSQFPQVSATYTFVIAASGGGGGGGGSGSVAVVSEVKTATVGVPFSYQPQGSGGTVASWYLYCTSGLPAGLDYNHTTGLLSGTPTVSGGPYAILLYPQDAQGNELGGGTLTLTINPAAPDPGSGGGSGSTDDSFIDLTQNLGTGALTVVNGEPVAFFGEVKRINVAMVPAANAGNVSEVFFTLKAKSEAKQYGALLSGTMTGDGTNFTTGFVAFTGEALRTDLTLYDDVEPDAEVTYSLEIFSKWSGHPRKSQFLDFVIRRPQDMDFAQTDAVLPPTAAQGGASVQAMGQAPGVSSLTGGGPTKLDGVPTAALPDLFLLQIRETGTGVTMWCLEPPGEDMTGDPRVVQPADHDAVTNNRQWVQRA